MLEILIRSAFSADGKMHTFEGEPGMSVSLNRIPMEYSPGSSTT